MNKLQLTKRLAREAHIGNQPTSTQNQTSELLRLVDWIDTAYNDIQLEENNWNFLREDFSIALTSGVNTYAKSVVSDLSNWHKEDLRIYTTDYSDEQEIVYVPWMDFRKGYMLGSSRTVEGRPSVFTIKPNKSIMFHPTPNASMTCVGEYFKVNDTMDDDNAEPIFNANYHLIVMWWALMLYSAHAAEPDRFAIGKDNADTLLSKMRLTELPKPYWGAPLV